MMKLIIPRTKRSEMLWIGVYLLLFSISLMKSSAKAQNITPAMFVFGDSLVDVGNNNYLSLSVIKANFPHNGIDFPTHKPNGRFSNGKNAADFLAEKLGLPTSPPYLSLTHNKSFNFFTGISFASGGAGIFDTTNKRYGIYDLGGRKFAVFGVGMIGCCPSQRDKNRTEACNEEANYWASKYNQGLVSILQQFKTNLVDFQYSYFDAYNVLLNLIQQPAVYGFKEVKAACCGLGDLNAKIPCLPISSYCPNRSDHVFWDLFHPTEATTRIITDTAFDGPPQYVFPVNIRQLASS